MTKSIDYGDSILIYKAYGNTTKRAMDIGAAQQQHITAGLQNVRRHEPIRRCAYGIATVKLEERHTENCNEGD